MRRGLKAMIVAGAAAFTIMAGEAPAVAHPGHWIYVSGDGVRRGAAQSDTNQRIHVCDVSIDGRQVRAHLRRAVDGQVFFTAWAPSQNCITENHSGAGIGSFRVCVEVWGCSDWHPWR